MKQRDITIIGVPIDLGAGRRGVDMGPSAIRYAGLCERLAALGHRITDGGNIVVPLAETIAAPAPGEKLRYLEPIVAINMALRERVAAVLAEARTPLVLGGDHNLAIGSVAGAARDRALGLIWVDAHADFNTAETTPSGNIHGMSLATLTGRGDRALLGIGTRSPVVVAERVALVGVRDIDPQERELLRWSGVNVFSMHDIDRLGIANVMDQAIAVVTAGGVSYHLSLDLDSLDPRDAPGVGTPVPGGISYREAHLAMEIIAQSDKLVSMDLVEVNPILDEHNATAEMAVELALSALGKRIL